MGITLAKINSNTAEVKVACGEDTITVTYFPAKVTERLYDQLTALTDAANVDIKANMTALNESLATLVKSWDIWEDDGVTPVPATSERLPDIPILVRVDVLAAICEDIQGNRLAAQRAS